MASIKTQLRNNAVALISLAVAVSSLAYNTWRNETTEAQRNVRHASFRVLEALGGLQEISDYRYYYLPFQPASGGEGELRVSGFGHASMIQDLTGLMPAPAPSAGEALAQAWLESVNSLDDLDEEGRHTAAATAAEERMTEAIRRTRSAVLEVLQSLE